jgi:hypothetical protein
MAQPNVLLRPEYRVDLNEAEIEILLEDVHVRLARLLEYLPLSNAYANRSIVRRIAILRILTAKLERPLTQETSNETKKSQST